MRINIVKLLATVIAFIFFLGFFIPGNLAQDNERDIRNRNSNTSPSPTPTATSTPDVPIPGPTQQRNTKTKVCISKPQKVGGNLTPETFMDRLLTYFESEPELQIIPIENVIDADQAKRRAVAANCAYLLRTNIDGETKGIKIKIIGNKKYKIAVEYFLDRLSDNQVLKTEKIEAANKDDEAAVNEVIGKIARGVFSVIGVGNNPNPTSQTEQNNEIPVEEETETMISPRLVVQTSHASSVTDFTYSKDGKLLATLGADGVVKIWLVKTKQEIVTIAGYDVAGIDFHPNGKQIACVSKNSVVRLFDVATGNLARRPFYEIKASEKKRDNSEATNLLLFNNPIPIAFTQTGRLLVVGKIGGVRVIDVPNGTSKTITTKDEDEVINSLSISPDGKLVATVIEKNKIKIWSLLSLKEIEEFKTGVEKVTALAFSRDGNKIAIGSINGSVKTFFVEKGKKHQEIVEKKGDSDPCGGVISLACKFIPGVDIAVRINNLIEEFTRIYKDESIRSLDFSPDGKTLAYHSGNNSVQVVDIETKASIFSVPTENKPVFSQGNAVTKFISKFFKQLCPVKFSSDGTSLNTCRELRNIQRWDAKTGESIETLAVSRRGLKKLLPFPIPFAVGSSASFLNERMLVISTLNGGIKIWDLESGAEPIHLLSESGLANIPLSSDGKFYIANLENGKGIGVFELESRKQIKAFDFGELRPFSASFSPDGKLFAVQLLEEKEEKKNRKQKIILSIRDISTGNELSRIENISPNQFTFSPDSKKVAYIPNGKSPLDFFVNKTVIKMWDIAAGQEIYKIKVVMETGNEFISKIAFSTDGKTFAAEDKNTIKLWETETGKQIQEVSITVDQDPFSLTFIPNRNVLTFTSPSGMYNWNIETNRITKLPLTGNLWGNLSYSPNGKSLVIGGAENRLKLIDAVNYKEIGSLVAPDEQDWLTVTPEGRFDAARLEDVTEVHWSMPDNPLELYPLEIFMRDYYEPRLLGRLAFGDTFAEIPNLSKRNRTIPKVEITDIARVDKDTVKVTVTAQNTFSEFQKDKAGKPLESGVYSLRLLRDSQLVGYSSEPDEKPLAVDNNGKVTRTFNVKLPTIKDKKEVEFSVYAFNSDQVKSLTSRKMYDLPSDLSPTNRKVYLVTIGANYNEISNLSLNYAANDAREMQRSLSARIKSTGKFDEIIEIPLISDFGTRQIPANINQNTNKNQNSNKKNNTTTNKDLNSRTNTNSTTNTDIRGGEHNATKAKIKGVIDLLSGRKPPAVLNVPNKSKITKAGPNDLVIITFSGHGVVQDNGVFYMVPSDLGGTGGVFSKIIERSISSNELSLWVRDLDAGEFLLVLDACYSGAFIEKGFKPGPMTSRGVGQLAYTKGIKILAATQENNTSMEVKNLKHGVLSFALINEGIEQNLADYFPTDKIVTTAEWLGFGVKRVPVIAADIKQKTNNPAIKERLLQQPKLFNFSRNRRGDVLFVSSN